MSSLIRYFYLLMDIPCIEVMAMSYRVEYDSACKWEKKKESWGIQRVLITVVFFLAFILAVSLFWTEGEEILVQLLLPEEAVLTWHSLQNLTENLQQGIPLQYAARDFYSEILQSCY